jgi:hypothetical protein
MAAATVLSVLAPPAARADEAKTPVSAALLLNILSAPSSESRELTFDKSLRDSGPAPRPAVEGEVQEDGSVRYGRGVVVTIKNPCPPGTTHFEPPPLPGRRSR